MVSWLEVLDPLHAGLFLLRLNEQHLPAGPTLFCDVNLIATSDAKLAACCQYFRQLLLSTSSPPPTTPVLGSHHPPSTPSSRLIQGAELDLPNLQSCVLSNLLDFIYSSRVARKGSKGTRHLSEAGLSLRVPILTNLVEEEEEAEPGQMKGKSRQCRGGEAMMEGLMNDEADGPENAKITLSFPLSAALPAALTVHNHRPSSATSYPRRRHSSSASKASNEVSAWKLDATTTDKRRPFNPPQRDSSPSSSSASSSPSSSSSPMDLTALVKKDIKSPPPLFKAGLDSQFHRFPPRSSNGPLGGYPGEGHRLTNGTASPSKTAQILFNLSTVAYRGQGGRGTDRKEKTGKKGGRVGSPQVGTNLRPPNLHLSPPLPHPSESFTLPPHSSSTPPDGPEPELICGVCHRLFSSALSLTAHMRLHRGGRALSCQHCGKAFIHNKRLQSHEASCTHALNPALPSSIPLLPILAKEEPLEEGEVRVEGGQIVGASEEDMKPGKGKKGRGLLVRHEGDVSELVGDEDHFVKVVDGHVIYFCSVCERSYMTLSSLKRHSNVHSWRRKYPCHFCDKVFALAEYRTKHEVWHTGERRYQCIFCWEAFATYYNLKTHQKAFHGISPGLISSEKTVNGGYKQKVNALKFYRLLPMRSQKRPYKTYSDSLANSLLLPPSDPPAVPLPQPLDCSLPGSLDLHSLISCSLPKGVKPDPDKFPAGFPLSVGLEQGEIPTLPPSLTGMALGRVADRETESEQVDSCGSSSKASVRNKVKTPKVSGNPELGLSSVITYGHSKPSVIVHGTAAPSVIVHSNQVTSGAGKGPLSSPSPEASNSQTLPKVSAKPVKIHRESTESHRKRAKLVDSSDATEEGERRSETGRSHHKSRKGHSKSDSSSAKQSSTGSEGKGAGPLCQITVRIGEEAMVKRSISETDLKRDRSPPPSRAKRMDSSPHDSKEPRHSHHHHHKHRSHRSSSVEAEGERGGDGVRENGEGDSRKKSPKATGKVREYYFRQEVRKQGQSEDDEDNLWRPYYSYKPKRKAPHAHKTKNWQRKLHYKRSLRLMRRAERLMDHVNKEDQEKEDGKMDEVEQEVGEVKDHMVQEEGEAPESFSTSSIPSKEKDKEGEEEIGEAHLKLADPPLVSPQPPLSTSVPLMDTKRRPWSDGSASECDTCGRWFSSSRKRDKHELSHLLEFVCLLCRAPFPSRDQLEDHQRAQHPKAPNPSSVPSRAGCQSRDEGMETETELTEVDRARERAILGKGSPSCLSRRSLARHTCPQCHKVCKTSSALNRHVRRHELSSSPEREKEETQTESKTAAAAETTVSTVSKDVDTTSDHVPIVHSVPVISYPIPETQHSSEAIEPLQCASQPSEVKAEHQTPTLCSGPELKELNELTTPIPDREPSPQIIQPPPEIPTADRPTPSPSLCYSSALQGVLVMSSGAECLDYRTPRKRSLEGQNHRRTSPAPVTSPNMAPTLQMRISHTAAPLSVAMTTVPLQGVCGVKQEGDIVGKGQREGCGMGLLHHAGFKNSPVAQDLRVPPLSRSPSPNQAQDLTMSSILAREREVERERQREWEREMKRELEREQDMERELERGRQRERDMDRELERRKQREREMDRELGRRKQREREMDRELGRERQREREMERAQQSRGASLQEQPRDMEGTLLVPKEEPISPAPSPIHTPIQTAINSPPLQRRPSKFPSHFPTAMDLLMQANQQVAQSLRGTQGLQRFQLPPGSVSGSDRPSAHALLLPRDPPPSEEEPLDHSPTPSRDPHRGEVTARGYPMQDYPLPLIVQGGYRSGKKQEDNLLMSYPTGPLAFGPLGKMVPTGDLAKLPFYPDPYHLLYGPQLLAYPYNLATLPMALNMMAPGGEKVEPLPFLPALFNYAAAAGPYAGMAPHHLVGNPSLYNSSGGSSKKQRDNSNGKL
ncbi:zinc finger and BTB domain-containing protein 38 [Oncorhynchus mykiss]|nr:zinc finger and BTB domain-containing protein 38 [Oncorhynchus mykiss]